jgi:DHA1 family tetracycline resistance protein-like MFS transporter
VNSLRGIAGLFGPGLFTYIFSMSIGPHAPVHLPGMPFFVASGMLVAGLGLMVVIRQTKVA